MTSLSSKKRKNSSSAKKKSFIGSLTGLGLNLLAGYMSTLAMSGLNYWVRWITKNFQKILTQCKALHVTKYNLKNQT